MAPNLDGVDEVDPWLVLKGLRIIYERNVGDTLDSGRRGGRTEGVRSVRKMGRCGR